MSNKVKPLPGKCDTPPANDGIFSLSDYELALFDSYAQELNRIAGTQVDFYSINVTASKRDSLYDEPSARVFNGPFRIYAFVEYPDQTTDTGEEGLRMYWTSVAWIARKELEDINGPVPKEGDIIRLWNVPYFNKSSVSGEKIANSGYYFDVVQVKDDGHLHDTASFVGFKLDLRRRTEYTPERKLTE